MTTPLGELIEIPARARRLYPRGRADGLEPVALQVLVCVVRDRPATTDAVAQDLELKSSTVRHALHALRQRDLVTAAADPDDARRRPHRATQAGEQLVRRLVAGVP